jgi:hypothetical protein
MHRAKYGKRQPTQALLFKCASYLPVELLTANEKCVTSGMEDYKRAQFLNEHAAGLETNMDWTSLGCNTDCHEPVISSQRLELSKTISEP